MSWDGCPKALQERFSILPILEIIESCVRRSEGERKHSERDERAQVPRWKPRGTCVSKNLNETFRLQSEKRQEWIREIRKKDYK